MASQMGVSLWRKVPADASAFFTDTQRARARAFTSRQHRIQLADSALTVAVWFAFTSGRVGHALARTVGGPWWVRAGAVVAAFTLVDAVCNLPVERARWKLDRESAGTDDTWPRRLRRYARGQLTNAPGSCALMVPIYALLRATSWWWLITAGLLLVIGGGISLLMPGRVVARRDEIRPLDDERIRRRLVSLAREAGVHVTDAQVLRSPSTDPNAFVMGTGPKQLLVLHEPALLLAPEVVDFMLAHELAHVRRHHVRGQFMVFAMSMTIALGAADLLLRSRFVFRVVLRFDSVQSPEVALVAMGAVAIALALTGAARNVWNRYAERVADLDALSFTRDPQAGEDLMAHYGALGRPIELGGWDYLRATHPPVAERIELMRRWRRTRTAAILFTDVVDSTSTVARVGDRAWVDMLHEHESLVRDAVSALQGSVVKDTGDGFLAELPDVGAAVLCAMRIQRAIAERAAAEPDTTVHARIGVHIGDVVRDRDDMRGREVHVAARVAGAAGADQILVSAEVAVAIADVDRFEIRPGAPTELKGLGAHVVHEVEWREPVLAPVPR
jgi:class 3 adenylate cyclase